MNPADTQIQLRAGARLSLPSNVYETLAIQAAEQAILEQQMGLCGPLSLDELQPRLEPSVWNHVWPNHPSPAHNTLPYKIHQDGCIPEARDALTSTAHPRVQDIRYNTAQNESRFLPLGATMDWSSAPRLKQYPTAAGYNIFPHSYQHDSTLQPNGIPFPQRYKTRSHARLTPMQFQQPLPTKAPLAPIGTGRPDPQKTMQSAEQSSFPGNRSTLQSFEEYRAPFGEAPGQSIFSHSFQHQNKDTTSAFIQWRDPSAPVHQLQDKTVQQPPAVNSSTGWACIPTPPHSPRSSPISPAFATGVDSHRLNSKKITACPRIPVAGTTRRNSEPKIHETRDRTAGGTLQHLISKNRRNSAQKNSIAAAVAAIGHNSALNFGSEQLQSPKRSWAQVAAPRPDSIKEEVQIKEEKIEKNNSSNIISHDTFVQANENAMEQDSAKSWAQVAGSNWTQKHEKQQEMRALSFGKQMLPGAFADNETGAVKNATLSVPIKQEPTDSFATKETPRKVSPSWTNVQKPTKQSKTRGTRGVARTVCRKR